jgi:hypothetical protein
MTLGLGRMLERLHAGLVPLRGTVNGYSVVKLDEREWLIHNSIVAAFPEDTEAIPLFLVGVAEEDLFWKDIRRVVFSRSRYTVMARLARDGLQTSWTPMKLLDVIREVLPPVAAQLEEGPRSFMTAARQGAAGTSEYRQKLIEALAQFAVALALTAESRLSADDLVEIAKFDDGDVDLDGPTANLRPIVNRTADYVAQRCKIERDSLQEAVLREEALTAAGIGLLASPASAEEEPEEPASERILDTKFVALYW